MTAWLAAGAGLMGLMLPCALVAATALVAFGGVNAMAADAVPTETFKVLTVDLALEAAQAAIAGRARCDFIP